jgi:hypothetical protein
MVDNPDVLYRLGNECLKECPTSFLEEEGNCVKKCSDGFIEEHHTSKCVPCPPEGCPKRCDGFNGFSELGIGRCTEFKKKKKIKRCSEAFRDKFVNCAVIDGNIDIDTKFTDKFRAKTSYALEALSTIEEITGYLSIHTNNRFSDFSFLRNLKRVRGIDLKPVYSNSCRNGSEAEDCRVMLQAAVAVQAINDNTLSGIRLSSLELIENGMVIIYANNSAVCNLPDKESLVSIMKKADFDPETDIIITNNDSVCRSRSSQKRTD